MKKRAPKVTRPMYAEDIERAAAHLGATRDDDGYWTYEAADGQHSTRDDLLADLGQSLRCM